MLRLEHVSKSYRPGDPPALDDLSLEIAPGEMVALIGPSGAGKSTLIRTINGLVTPDAGRVFVAGQEVTGRTGADLQAVRQLVSIIFQEFHLIDRLPALTNVLSGRFGRYSFWQNVFGRWSEQDRSEAQRLLERVGLGAFGGAAARELSGGQRQRVAIARAMMQQPKLLLGDEPVASLDPVTARSVLQLIAELSEEQGLTTVLSLHDVTLAKEFCRRAVAVSAGRVVYDGPVAGLTEDVLAAVYSGGEPGGSSGQNLGRTSAQLALEKGCGKPKASSQVFT